MENISMLPQPAGRTGGVMRALSELSDNDNNARNAMLPPSSTSLKRQGSHLPEPAQTKRKTLAERAGEPLRPPLVSTTTTARQSKNNGPNTISSTSLYRSSSSSSSMPRSISTTSRNTSSSSLTGSLSGPGPPSASSSDTTLRPRSAYGRHGTGHVRSNTSIAHLAVSHEMLGPKKAFDPDLPYQDFKRMFEDYKNMYQESITKIDETRQENSAFRENMTKLEQERLSQLENMVTMRSENETLKYRIGAAERNMFEQKRDHEAQLEELKRSHRTDIEQQRQHHRDELERTVQSHREDIRQLRAKQHEELDHERRLRTDLSSQVSLQDTLQKQQHQVELDRKDQDLAVMRLALKRADDILAREKEHSDSLRHSLNTAGENASSMEAARQALDAKIAYLESGNKVQAEKYEEMKQRMHEAIERARLCEERLRKEESMRRRLHNQVQELKGNIRVFCRVRPTLVHNEDLAKMRFPDVDESTEIEVRGQDEMSSLGKDTTKNHPFSFDRVFSPTATNEDVFGEISQLIQSALDGYNVCIFAYGQTGSGKTYTMSSEDGMIPRALRQIYTTSRDLEDRGWSYTMQGSFIEVYNEDLRDLLSNDDKPKKHEIRHDASKSETSITDITTLSLDTQDQVESILSQAMARRSVAATKANEHSSRSHSVFILKLQGENSVTGEKSKGTLNLVDLAGSERVKNADTSGERLKETQSINKSLSCLGDVIGALGQPSPDLRASLSGRAQSPAMAHIPYRNSKLTYLLQYSLGGNSKTLMFVMVAPEKRCLSETLTSLRFADKVSKTRIGVAKRVK